MNTRSNSNSNYVKNRIDHSYWKWFFIFIAIGIGISLTISFPISFAVYNPLKFHCMMCGKEHKERACPRCGSTAVTIA
jgi:hypothetical protein